VLPWQIEVKQAVAEGRPRVNERIEHLLVTNEFSDRRETKRKLRVFDLRDGDTKTVRNLLAYRKVGLEGGTEELWVPPSFRQRVRCRGE
jgi:putative DNA primase/helicase